MFTGADATHEQSMAPTNSTRAKVCLMRFLVGFMERRLSFILWAWWNSQSTTPSVIFLCSDSKNYVPQAIIAGAFKMFWGIVNQICYTIWWSHHFCVTLTVTRKFRLCLQPHGLLRVQSLHLPVRAWLGVFCTKIVAQKPWRNNN